MPTLVLLRHGQSQWNLENRFTGWWDVDITAAGEAEARAAGELLRDKGFDLDRVFTSVQKRAIRTANLTLEAMDRLWLPVIKDWRLNERHYGALTGLNKAETAAKYGDQQVLVWRRSYAIRPPEMATSATKGSPPVPSSMVPPRTTRSYSAIALLLDPTSMPPRRPRTVSRHRIREQWRRRVRAPPDVLPDGKTISGSEASWRRRTRCWRSRGVGRPIPLWTESP